MALPLMNMEIDKIIVMRSCTSKMADSSSWEVIICALLFWTEAIRWTKLIASYYVENFELYAGANARFRSGISFCFCFTTFILYKMSPMLMPSRSINSTVKQSTLSLQIGNRIMKNIQFDYISRMEQVLPFSWKIKFERQLQRWDFF